MRVIIEPNYEKISEWAARYVVSRINAANPTPEKPFVLGCPTGSSPIGLYKKLIEYNKAGKVSFKNVITFNMDEYCNLPEEHPESYHSFMWNTFFKHIDINPENVNILNGNAEDIEAECANYEARIKAAGGVDLFMGGVGPDGHIAFNEPTASLYSRTHEQALTEETILANCRFFDNDMTKVPKTALTVGVGTILDAKSVMIVANGYGKTRALKDAIEGGVSQMCPLSALQLHPNAMFIVDETAVSELKVSTYRFFKDVERNNIDPESIKI
ncbi:MAG: glucosamine-6-phosphate deaminase [Bacteroidales bacterium]|nr:glucosamine-6-phosphate deaminase [Candidatus Sodaliphilus aphodohippi]